MLEKGQDGLYKEPTKEERRQRAKRRDISDQVYPF